MTDRKAILQKAMEQVGSDVDFIHALAKRREELGLSQQDVATRAGWPLGTVQDIESLKRDPTLGELRRFALAIRASVKHNITEKD